MYKWKIKDGKMGEKRAKVSKEYNLMIDTRLVARKIQALEL